MEQVNTGQPQASAQLSPDKNLLLLGLQLLNKGLRLPYAVVQPQVQTISPQKNSGEKEDGRVSTDEAPLSPQNAEEKEPSNRKRKRNPNDDLSEAERREKRKMNNRVAAQNARDRRKHYLEDLERKVALLEEQNKLLLQDNQLLRERSDTLAAEKEKLEQQLVSMDQTVISLDQTDFLSALVKESLLESRGSAAPAVSLQQKQVIPSALLIQAWTVISLTYWLTCLKSGVSVIAPSPPPHHVMQHGESHTSHAIPLDQLLRLPTWWGASQTTWNPPRN